MLSKKPCALVNRSSVMSRETSPASWLGCRPRGGSLLHESIHSVPDAAHLEPNAEVLDDLVQIGEHVRLSVERHVVKVVERDQSGVGAQLTLGISECLAYEDSSTQRPVHFRFLHVRFPDLLGEICCVASRRSLERE